MRRLVKQVFKNTNFYFVALKTYNQFHLLRKNIISIKKSFSLISFKDLVTKNNLKYTVFETEMYRESFIPNYYRSKSSSTIKKELLPDVYCCELNNVKVVGGNSFVLYGDYCLYDIPFQNNSHNYNLNHGSVDKIDIDKSKIDISYFDNQIYIDKGITLLGHAANNYYHFTIDLLPRLYYIDKIAKFKDYPLLIDERACEYYKKLINFANKNNRKIIPIKRDVAYEIGTLAFPSMVSWNPVYRVSSDYVNAGNYYANKPFFLYKEIKNLITKEISDNKRKVFISRRDVSRHYLNNETDVENMFKQHGFEIVAPGELNYEEQVKLFSEINVLAGAEGAAFANMVYMPKDAKVFCIVPKDKNKFMVSSLAKTIGLECEYLNAELINENDHYMDLDYLEKFLVEFSIN